MCVCVLLCADARYVVDSLVQASSGEFYRASGTITRLVPTNRFKRFVAASSASITDQIRNQGLTFKKGCAYYEHSKKETIQSYKNIVIEDVATNELFEGDVARQLLGLPAYVSCLSLPSAVIGAHSLLWLCVQRCGRDQSATLRPSRLALPLLRAKHFQQSQHPRRYVPAPPVLETVRLAFAHALL